VGSWEEIRNIAVEMDKKAIKIILYLVVVGVVLCTSCVPNKKITYLQYGDELKERDEIVVDEVVRTRPIKIEEYRIQPLDVLMIQFESITNEEFDFFSTIEPQGGGNQQNQMLNGVIVDAQGNVEYPMIGKVNLTGLTIFEAQEKLQLEASRYLTDVVTRVRPLNFRFTVLGEVNQEQVVTSQNTRITMMEAIGMSGGFSELADRSIVKVIRQEGDLAKIHYVNLLEEDFIESDFYYVHQNDIIEVPPLKQRTFRKYFTSNLGVWTATLSAVLLAISLFTR
jgi:polysaccharide export outer membrane protein